MLAATEAREILVETPDVYDFLYQPPLGEVRSRTSYGGRGGARSWQFARALLVHGRTKRLRILCAREWQSSIKDSVHRVLSDQIVLLGLQDFYEIQEASIYGANGTEFLFKGLRRDIAAIKSTEGIDICWVEEAQTVSDRSWRDLIPTIRAHGSEIWVTFNTGADDDPTYLRFVAPTIPEHPLYDPQYDGIVRKTSHRDNPWFPEVLQKEERKSFRTDPEEHAHVWDGEFWKRSKAQVLNGKWEKKEFTPQESWGHPYFGADWGFSNDPTILCKLWVHDGFLYLEYESGGIQLDESGIVTAFDEIPGSRKYQIRADSARPETISAISKKGFSVIAAPKWTGSVEDGISHLRSYTQIIIHPRCTRAVQEARLWSYKTRPGASGDPHAADAEILPELKPGNDHVWDAARYALAPLIKKIGVGVFSG
jgi:phage terminase large subunit